MAFKTWSMAAGAVLVLLAARAEVGAGGPVDSAPGAPASAMPEVVVNGTPLTQVQIFQLLRAYGRVATGRLWYDPVSGLWGAEGYGFSGYIQPGLPLGRVSPRASNGHTGIFLNGREINLAEQRFYELVFSGPAHAGRFWLDGYTGNIGIEGYPVPLLNLVAAIQSHQPASQRGPGFWSGGVSGPGGMVGAGDGQCAIVSTDAGSWSTGGC
jgi:hypothetical protein